VFTGEYQLTPTYDLMSTVVHTPSYYGRDNFMELSKRLGIIEKRAAMIVDQFPGKEKQIRAFVEQSFLSEAVKAKYTLNVAERINPLLVWYSDCQLPRMVPFSGFGCVLKLMTPAMALAPY
jgi:hypothetical protein